MPKRTVPHTALFTTEEQDALAGLLLSASLEDFAKNGPASRVLSLEIQGLAPPGVAALLVVQPMDAAGLTLHRLLQAVCEAACSHIFDDCEPTRQEHTRWVR